MNKLRQVRRDLRETARENWGTDSVPDALERAKRTESTTDTTDRPRCPKCNTITIVPKACRYANHTQRGDGAYRCLNSDCRHHFDNPAYADRE